MPQDYKIVHLDEGKQPYVDQNGNHWLNVLFEGATNEPIKWVVKDPSQYQINQIVYGHIELKEGQSGKKYNRFYRDQKDDYQKAASYQQKPAGQLSNAGRDDNTQESIARSVALKAAVDTYAATPDKVTDTQVLKLADSYLAWLQGSGSRGGGKVDPPQSFPLATNEIQNPVSAAVPGTQARDWSRVGKNQTVDDPEAQSLYNSIAQSETYPDSEYQEYS